MGRKRAHVAVLADERGQQIGPALSFSTSPDELNRVRAELQAQPQLSRLDVHGTAEDKPTCLAPARSLRTQGYRLRATAGSARYLAGWRLEAESWNKVSEGSPHTLRLLTRAQVHLVINTPARGEEQRGRDPHPPHRTRDGHPMPHPPGNGWGPGALLAPPRA
ncbi:MAG TPA: hypothetical protein GX513_11845, partial [Firmicutes bacterium]|nr:hypothetical protein [Bacillota bacterium]